MNRLALFAVPILVLSATFGSCGGPRSVSLQPSAAIPAETPVQREPTCFSNSSFHLRTISLASLRAELANASAAVGTSIPLPSPPHDVNGVAVGVLPSDNGAGTGFDAQFNWSDQSQPVVAFSYTPVPICWFGLNLTTQRDLRIDSTIVWVFDWELAGGSLKGKKAQFKFDGLSVEVNLLWTHGSEPDDGRQMEAVRVWVDAVLHAPGASAQAP